MSQGRITRLLFRSTRRKAAEAVPPELDAEFYREWYSDLAGMSQPELTRHWRDCGSSEGRFPNFDALLAGKGLDVKRLPASFDWRVYLASYGDLGRAGLTTKFAAIAHFLEYGLDEGRTGEFNEAFYTSFYRDLLPLRHDREAAICHWLEFGKREGRSPTFRHLVCSQGLPGSLVRPELDAGTLWPAGAREEGWRRAAEVLTQEPPGLQELPWIGPDIELFYADLAGAHEQAGNDNKAREIYLALALRSVLGAQVSMGLANIAVRASWREGDSHKREQLQRLAKSYYMQVLRSNAFAVDAKVGVSRCLSELGRHDEALDQALQTLAEHPESPGAEASVVSCAEFWWHDQWANADALAAAGERVALHQKAVQIAVKLSDAQRHVVLRGNAKDNAVRRCQGGRRVLLVADTVLPQCLRYRVEQKLEQLEVAGFQAKAVPWTEAAKAEQELAFHDVVIFYRTPALPQVVRLISAARSLGKATYFEIDDFLFDPEYPAPIETYGGYVSPGQYINLIKGGALFRAAAELCDDGIASTRPLAEHLAARVRTGRCFLHRNGFDSMSPLSMQADVADESAGVNLFYGSATYAHNSDFIDEAMPAIAKVLAENTKVTLTVAGHLKLPDTFVNAFGARIQMLPLARNLGAYYASMARSHVNLAVLKPDRINDCKSELKWFEAAAMGIPAIVSPTRNYLEVVRSGEDALVASGEDEWYAALRTLVDSAAERVRIGATARSRVLSEYSVESLATNLKSILVEGENAVTFAESSGDGAGASTHV